MATIASGSVRPRINFTSGFDPSPRKRSVFGASVLSRKITSCQDDVRFLNTSRTFYIIQNFGIHGNRLPDDLRLSPLREVSSRNGQKRATRNKAKKFAINDGVLHYIAKEWMHVHNCFQKKEMQPFPLTRTAPHHQSYFPLRDRQVLELVPHSVHVLCIGLARASQHFFGG